MHDDEHRNLVDARQSTIHPAEVEIASVWILTETGRLLLPGSANGCGRVVADTARARPPMYW